MIYSTFCISMNSIQVNRLFSEVFNFFSSMVPMDTQATICQNFGIGLGSFDEKYLGMPIRASRSTCKQFSYLVDRVWHKLSGWKEKLLTQAQKEVLIKVVIQALSSYTMQCFLLSKGNCRNLVSLTRKFWWEIIQGHIYLLEELEVLVYSQITGGS